MLQKAFSMQPDCPKKQNKNTPTNTRLFVEKEVLARYLAQKVLSPTF